MRRTSLILAGLVGLGVAGAAQAATTVVLPGDVGTALSNPNGWHWSAPNPSPSGTVGEFVNGPGTPPLGTGSYHANMVAFDDYVSLDAGNLYVGRALADLESVTFSFYSSSTPASGEQMDIIIRVDDDGNGASNALNGRVLLQPAHAVGILADDQWHTVTFSRSADVWELPGFPGTIVSLDDVYLSYPNAVLVGNNVPVSNNSFQSTFRIAAGSGGNPNSGYFDNLTFVWDNDQNPAVDASLVSDTYDFELVAPPIPEPASLGLLAGGAGLTLLRRKRA
jgi:hypothetical protein